MGKTARPAPGSTLPHLYVDQVGPCGVLSSAGTTDDLVDGVRRDEPGPG